MKYAILGYNNSVHLVTNYTHFQIIKRHIDTDDPFFLTEIDSLQATRNVIKNVQQLYTKKLKFETRKSRKN